MYFDVSVVFSIMNDTSSSRDEAVVVAKLNKSIARVEHRIVTNRTKQCMMLLSIGIQYLMMSMQMYITDSHVREHSARIIADEYVTSRGFPLHHEDDDEEYINAICKYVDKHQNDNSKTQVNDAVSANRV